MKSIIRLNNKNTNNDKINLTQEKVMDKIWIKAYWTLMFV